MTLTEFLLARIAEDEAVARDVIENATGVLVYGDFTDEPLWVLSGTRRGSIAMLITPARVLAECEAKRRIVELAPWANNAHQAALKHPAGNAILHWLALPYADHPDYDEAWRP